MFLKAQVRSLLDAKYKTDHKIIDLKNKCNSLERDLEEKTQVPFVNSLVLLEPALFPLGDHLSHAVAESEFIVLILYSSTIPGAYPTLVLESFRGSGVSSAFSLNFPSIFS